MNGHLSDSNLSSASKKNSKKNKNFDFSKKLNFPKSKNSRLHIQYFLESRNSYFHKEQQYEPTQHLYLITRLKYQFFCFFIGVLLINILEFLALDFYTIEIIHNAYTMESAVQRYKFKNLECYNSILHQKFLKKGKKNIFIFLGKFDFLGFTDYYREERKNL